MFHYCKLQNTFLDYTLLCQKKALWMISNQLSPYHCRSIFTTYEFYMIHQDTQVYILSSKFRLLGHSRSDSDSDHMSHCIHSQTFHCYNLNVKKNKSYGISIIYIVRLSGQLSFQWSYMILGARTDTPHADDSVVH